MARSATTSARTLVDQTTADRHLRVVEGGDPIEWLMPAHKSGRQVHVEEFAFAYAMQASWTTLSPYSSVQSACHRPAGYRGSARLDACVRGRTTKGRALPKDQSGK